MTAPRDPALAAPPPARQWAYGVYIGRFQPPHQAHLLVMLEALQNVGQLIVVIGSARAARTTKNPFTAEERQQVISAMLREAGVSEQRLRFVPVRDHLYNEGLWLSEVQGGVAEQTRGSRDVALIGHIKDESSYYLRSFPTWTFLPTHVVSPLNATDVRRALFEDRLSDVAGMVPPATQTFLQAFQETPQYAELRAEYSYLRAYRSAWAQAPFPPVFVTADAVVTRSGHVLTVRRAGLPGRGQLALPGGFLAPEETLLHCAVRRASSETGLSEAAKLPEKLRAQAVFDAPGRSQRGRTVTHAFHFDLGTGPLPELHAAADAAEARWLPFSEALAHPEEFFEDHHAIIEHFLLRA